MSPLQVVIEHVKCLSLVELLSLQLQLDNIVKQAEDKYNEKYKNYIDLRKKLDNQEIIDKFYV